MPGVLKLMPFGDAKDNFQMIDFLNKGGFDQSKSQSPHDVVQMLQYAKIIGKAQELEQENQKEDSKKNQSFQSKSEKLEQELSRILSRNNNKLFVTTKHQHATRASSPFFILHNSNNCSLIGQQQTSYFNNLGVQNQTFLYDKSRNQMMTTLNMHPAMATDPKGRAFQIEQNFVKINGTYYNLSDLHYQQMQYQRDFEFLNFNILGNGYLGEQKDYMQSNIINSNNKMASFQSDQQKRPVFKIIMKPRARCKVHNKCQTNKEKS